MTHLQQHLTSKTYNFKIKVKVIRYRVKGAKRQLYYVQFPQLTKVLELTFGNGQNTSQIT